MKTYLLALSFLLLGGSLTAQDFNESDKKAIESRINVFLDHTKNKKYSELLNFMYPKVFEETSREQMLQILGMVENMGIGVDIQKADIQDIKNLYTKGADKYALIGYRLEMDLKLETKESQGISAMIVSMTSSQFGKENVSFDKEKNTISVKGDKYLIGINEKQYGDWYFLEYELSKPSSIQDMVPGEVVEAAKQYK